MPNVLLHAGSYSSTRACWSWLHLVKYSTQQGRESSCLPVAMPVRGAISIAQHSSLGSSQARDFDMKRNGASSFSHFPGLAWLIAHLVAISMTNNCPVSTPIPFMIPLGTGVCHCACLSFFIRIRTLPVTSV